MTDPGSATKSGNGDAPAASGRGRQALGLMAGLLFLYASVVIFGLGWIEARFGADIEPDAILFTMALPKQGGYSQDLILTLALWLTPALILTAGFCLLVRRSLKRPANPVRAALLAVSAAAFLCANYQFEERLHLFSFFLKPRAVSTLYEDFYRKVGAEEVVWNGPKRNIIMVMLEAVEETFNDENFFGERLMPELQKLREENTSFYGFQQTLGATWTIGGLTAYMFGLPLTFPSGFGQTAVDLLVNEYGQRVTGFLPGAGPIVSILEKHGYEVEVFLGSDDAFAGQGRLFRTHLKNLKIYDYTYFEKLRAAGRFEFREKPFWGMPDHELYAAVKQHLLSTRRDKPFFLLMQTMDTHLSEEYFNHQIPVKWNDERDNIAEASFMAADFVRWVQERDFGPDTTIILIGDHLRMTDLVGPVALPSQYDGREIYNVFINPVPDLADKAPRRHYASFDLAPTILESAGATLPAGLFGLGTSLFAPGRETLFESRGRDYYSEEVRKKSLFYESLFLESGEEALHD